MASRAETASLRRPDLQRVSKCEVVAERETANLVVGFDGDSNGYVPALVGIVGTGSFKLQGITSFSIVVLCKFFFFFWI